jgi:hypothetical protein
MSAFLLESSGRVPPRQQTRVAAFLISAHGALARRLAFALPGQMKTGWQTELNAQLYREAETVSLLMRATSWVADPELLLLAISWEAAWLPTLVSDVGDASLAFTIDTAALGHAVHAAIRPAVLLPEKASAEDPFVMALRRIEFESSRVMQAQIIFLKGQDLLPFRDAVNTAVEQRHRQVRELWDAMLTGIGVERETKSQASRAP